LDTKNQAGHSSSLALLLAMFQIKGRRITAVDGSVTCGTSDNDTPIFNTGIDYVGPFEIKGGNTRRKTTTKC
jgi:hypothetical protein